MPTDFKPIVFKSSLVYLLFFFHCFLNFFTQIFEGYRNQDFRSKVNESLITAFFSAQKSIPRIVCSKQSGANYVIICNTSPQTFSKSKE